MDFTKELHEFPSEVHRRIYVYAREVLSLEVTTSGITDAKLRKCCADFHGLTMHILSDMYDNPEEYCLPVGELEKFLGGKKVNGVKRKFPSKTKTLLSWTHNSADRYFETLCKIAYLGELKGRELYVSKTDFPALEKAVNTSKSPISLEKRLKALARSDFTYNGECFTCESFPDLFPALCAMAKKTNDKTSGFPYYLFARLDFRNLDRNFKPNHVEYFSPLFKEEKENAYRIHDMAVSLGCKETISTFFKVDYKYKGVQVMLIDSENVTLQIRITEVYSWDDKNLIERRLLEGDKHFQKYALRHLWRCTGCATTHLGQFVELLGTKNRVCGGGLIGFYWQNPTEEDLTMIKEFLKMRCEIIDEMKANGMK